MVLDLYLCYGKQWATEQAAEGINAHLPDQSQAEIVTGCFSNLLLPGAEFCRGH